MKLSRILIFILLALLVGGGFLWFQKDASESFSLSTKKTITVTDGKLEFVFRDVTAKTVGDFLKEQELILNEGDSIFPSEGERLYSGERLSLSRAHTFSLRIDGGEQSVKTRAENLEEALRENNIALDEDDIISPSKDVLVSNELVVKVTRVQIEEEVKEKPIAFSQKSNEDSELSWRKKIVTQKGEPGIERLTYRVSRHDGKEVNRKLLKTEKVKDPVDEIVTQGTYVKTGKSHSGGASWYAHTGTLAAANPWLPMGSYVRVTNTENGKSVIVVINDRGPFGAGRIIDLDKVAFQKIASLGQGVVNVKMEEIVN